MSSLVLGGLGLVVLNKLGPEQESLGLMPGFPKASVLFPKGPGFESGEPSPEPGTLTLPGSPGPSQ